MRSQLVFDAAQKIENRYLLCRFVCMTTRAFHKNGVPIQDTVNRALTLVEKPVHVRRPPIDAAA